MIHKVRFNIIKKALMVFVSAFFMAASSGAQSQDTPTQGKVPQESVVPLAALKKLEILSGKWQLVVDMSFDNGKTWQSSPPAVVDIHTRHKGLMLAEYPQDLNSPGFHMETYITYDQYRKVYRKAAIDDVWGIMDLYEGTIQNDMLVMTNVKAGTFFPVGNDVWRAFRLTMELTSPKRTLTIEKSDDGGATWQPAFIANYSLISE